MPMVELDSKEARTEMPMDVVLRRLKSDDIGQVVEIEREAFSPLWISTPFKREINNRYASYLVACVSPEPEEVAGAATGAGPERGWPWRGLVKRLRRLADGRRPGSPPSSYVAGYVSVWYQGEEAHITEIAVREKLRAMGLGSCS